MEVRRVRPAGGVRLAAGHRDDAPEAHLVLLAASTPEGDMLVNLGPGQSGWATQLVSDRHVLGVRLVEQLWTPPHAPTRSPAGRAKGRGAGGTRGMPGGWRPNDRDRGGHWPHDTCRGCLSRNQAP